MDVSALSTGLALAKSGFDTLRTAIGLVKDVQEVLPPGEKKETVARTLEEAGKQVRLAEAQIAQALGYPLCRCDFPPTPMFAVGYRSPIAPTDKAIMIEVAKKQGHAAVSGGIVVHECPRCGQNDAGPWAWDRTVSGRQPLERATNPA
jgi:hypothetical protein